MAWNEPGKNGQNNDPWGDRNKQDGPPDLDEMLRRAKETVARFFGGKKGTNGSGNKGGSTGSSLGISFLLLIALVVWAAMGIYVVQEGERGVELRFGKYHLTAMPGLHWIPRIIDTKYIVNIDEVSVYPYRDAMLTMDENIVSVAVAVQYRLDDPKDFLFNVRNPRLSLEQATASALRQVIGNTVLEDVLTTGRETVRNEVETQLNETLAIYNPGLMLVDVALQVAEPPSEVTDAFDDAIKAREDEQRFEREAQTYVNRVVPGARGQASRLIEEAQAYREQVILQAETDIAQFSAILEEYKLAPKIMRERLYLGAMESILKDSSKVLIDTDSSNNLLYLPIDKLVSEGSAKAQNKGVTSSVPSARPYAPVVTRDSRVDDAVRSSTRSFSR